MLHPVPRAAALSGDALRRRADFDVGRLGDGVDEALKRLERRRDLRRGCSRQHFEQLRGNKTRARTHPACPATPRPLG